jgi:3-oxoacyl-(acyl-carrier-protein) synthase/3-hydroxymyristoyl/3-hydroxydecanoyl-(acyl carrier protein) dehydratase/1-acyl-sn-glycerol-3-phosphate acyltransferase
MFGPIAIVGRACVLPGALSPDALWDAVVAGRSLIGDVPEGRWRRAPEDSLCAPDGDATDRSWSARGGYVRGFEEVWDPAGFAMPASALAGLDPVVLWTLHAAREALRDAGDVGDVDRSRTTAVFGNLGYPSAGMTRWLEGQAFGEDGGDPRNRFLGGGTAAILQAALRLAPDVFCLDTACASSLYAIKLACDRLHDGAADVALAGAVASSDDLFIHVGFCALQAMSRTGQSRPFHRDADGLVPGEGAGFVVLKRLEDAVADGDRVHGVIRGVGLSNDGRGRGFLAPAEEGQRRALVEAYRQAGIEPAAVGLLECHATGTAVGDATEIRSTAAVFDGLAGVPVGSLKSNLGHLVTAAGVAGLIKVLEAMRHGVRPPTVGVDAGNPALEGSPFRVLTEPEPWPDDVPRVAGLSAFGFGGNNAHLVLSEGPGEVGARARFSSLPLAVIGVGAVVGSATDSRQLAAATSLVQGERGARTDSFELDLAGLRFPPSDLGETLPQQLVLLKAAREAAMEAGPLPRERTGLFVGLEPDVEVARYGVRWRASTRLRARGLDPAAQAPWLAAAMDAAAPALTSAAVVGCMPNIPTNRLNSALDLGGPGVTVSEGEGSGGRALQLAARALRSGELDAALVGAVDLCCSEAHVAALAAIEEQPSVPGDAAVALVIKRLADATRDGDRVLAVIEDGPPTPPASFDHRLGRSWAAGELRDVAALVLALDAAPAGTAAHVGFRAAPALRLSAVGSTARPPAPRPARPLRFDAHRPPLRLPPLPALAPTPEPAMQTMPPAPVLPSVGLHVAGSPTAPAAPPAVAQAVAAPEFVAPHAVDAPRAEPAASIDDDPSAAALRRTLLAVGAGHAAFLQAQAELHQRFLHGRAEAMHALLVAAGQPPAPAAIAPPVAPPSAPAAASFAAVAPPAAAPVAPPAAAPVAPPRVADAPAPPPAAAPLPHGPTFDFDALKTHSSGRISDLFGPLFAVQDDYVRQVRMPEPPLLLADRVTGLDAVPGSMKTGTIWTESDVLADRWFMHQGAMPMGILIESGQADLMLISYLGVDFTNRGERAYRLLGCELTLHGGLPVPGETLAYDIHLDGHAKQGDVRLMFFHYECRVGGAPRLSVKKGQAGFFTDAELADSDGCLWTPEGQEIVTPPRLAPPKVACARGSFTAEEVRAFADGQPWRCFGPGFELTQTHTRTPRIQGGRMLFLEDGVDAFAPRGGPWGRGYLKATVAIRPDHWFFAGHFKNDPCMPGTLMFEGALQAMAFHLSALGFTVDKDGHRFEPVPEVPVQLSCRGQVTPTSRELIYEVFVEEVIDAPLPTIYADVLCTVDGLKAFHARRVGLQLTPSWPLDAVPRVPDPHDVADADGFPFDARSMLACANGRPSEAFGPMYAPFDGPTRVARLPNPPYLFVSRAVETSGPIGSMQPGLGCVIDYDVPPDAWYFDENGARTMPFAVLLEAALQPCGWLASYTGCALAIDGEAFFRNLDGTGTLHVDVLPESGTLRTHVTNTGISKAGAMIIVSFAVECFLGDVLVYDMTTVFGFFPAAALAHQVGLPTTDAQRALLTAPGEAIDLTTRPARYFAPDRPRLSEPMLLMIDRVTRWEPEGGAAGLGVARAEKDIDPGEWFFKAHFFQDPVQPGSLGIEAMVALLQWAMLERGLDEGVEAPRFEPLMTGRAMTWKYRGQVVPTNRVMSTTIELTEIGRDERGPFAICTASLWVDGKRIYEASELGMRIVAGGVPSRPGLTLDPSSDPWLLDHCPTYTRPALPMMSMVDLLASAASIKDPVVGLRDVRVKGWLDVAEGVTLRTERRGERVRLLRDDGSEVATARVLTGEYPPRPAPLPRLEGPESDAYDRLFHGPAFRVLQRLVMTGEGSSSILSASSTIPIGRLNPALLDGATHGIPHDALSTWDPKLPGDQVAYPALIPEMSVHGPTPTSGEVRCEVRPDGFFGTAAFPAFRVQLIDERGVWCAFRLVEACFPKGRIGAASPADRRAFLRDRTFVPGLSLSTIGQPTTLTEADVAGADWLPGTVEAIYGSRDVDTIARKEHIAHAHGVHPGRIPEALPLTSWDLPVQDGAVSGDPMGTLDLAPVRAFWSGWFDRGPWPVEDLYYGLCQRFVRRVVLDDPAAFAAIRGRSALFLANHQCGVESLLFSILASGLSGVPTVTLAKIEHQTTWLGRLIAHCFAYPGVRDPRVIAFFDREHKASLPGVMKELAADMAGVGRSVMVHVEGTRSLSCRTPVQKMSGGFLDMAMAVGAPVVPVRFVGALPTTDLAVRTEFPVGMGQQDIHFGRPIEPEELAALHYGARKERVIDAINALGPSHADEEPLPGDPAFAARVEAWLSEHDVDPEHAVLREVLAEQVEPCEEVRRLLAGDVAGDPWLEELARRLR